MALNIMMPFRYNTKGKKQGKRIDKPDFIEIKTSGV